MLKRRIAAIALTATLSIATAVVTLFEGDEPEAYVDPVGVVTVCYGHTATAQLGQTHTDDKCDELLKADLGIALAAVDRHADVDLPIERRAALASFVFNVGESAFKRSTLLRKLNAGDPAGACAELSRWVYAGGRKLEGLVRRRQVERELCEVGL